MNSLQIAVAAYIAEHGSIDADTYQALTDLYTTEIRDETIINANAKRAENRVIASRHNADHPNKDSAAYQTATMNKEVNTLLGSAKLKGKAVVNSYNNMAKLGNLGADASDAEQTEVIHAIREFMLDVDDLAEFFSQRYDAMKKMEEKYSRQNKRR